MPDQKGRLEILKVHARNKKLGEDVDLSEVASRVPGFTGADLANLLNEVSHIPARPQYVTWPRHFCCLWILLPCIHLSVQRTAITWLLTCASITTEMEV